MMAGWEKGPTKRGKLFLYAPAPILTEAALVQEKQLETHLRSGD